MIAAAGGHVFVGDVRSLLLAEAYHASVEVTRAAPGEAAGAVRQRVGRHLRQEEELLLDARAVRGARARLAAGRGACDARSRPGAYDNELSRFRYDVTLTVGPKMRDAAPIAWVPWDAAGTWRSGSRRASGGGADRRHRGAGRAEMGVPRQPWRRWRR